MRYILHLLTGSFKHKKITLSLTTIIIALLFNLSTCFAQNEPVTIIEFNPLSGDISTSTVTTNSVSGGSDETTWVTAPSVAMRGRKGVLLVNMHLTEEVYVSRATGLTTAFWWPLYPKQSMWVRAGSDMPIFVSSNTVINVRTFEIR